VEIGDIPGGIAINHGSKKGVSAQSAIVDCRLAAKKKTRAKEREKIVSAGKIGLRFATDS